MVASIFLKELSRASLSSEKLGQWRRKWQHISTLPFPQVHYGLSKSWRLCLNLRLPRWLKPRQLNVKFGVGLINAKTFLKNVQYLIISDRAQESQFIIRELKMTTCFNITVSKIAVGVKWVKEAMFKLMFPKITQTET